MCEVREICSYDDYVNSVLDRLQKIYARCIKPLEERTSYDLLNTSWYGESIFQKQPLVTFLGPFSAGKSTFINYLLRGNHLATGPQPVTDKFTVIMHGDHEGEIPGQVLCSDSKLPYRALGQFGDSFIQSFHGLTFPSDILRNVTLIDTPGVLEAAGSHRQRQYDYVAVLRWFVEKSDLVFVMFDPSKLDTGPELRQIFLKALRNNEAKLRIILNKADTIEPQELLRVYGGLFWSLSNIVQNTEPPRVYISSFWEKPYRPGTDHELFRLEKGDILYDLIEVVPVNSLDHRVAGLIVRARRTLNHAVLCATLRDRMPRCCCIPGAIKEELEKLGETMNDVAMRNKLGTTDYAEINEYKVFFDKRADIMAMPRMTEIADAIRELRAAIDTDLPGLLHLPKGTQSEDPKKRREALLQYHTSQIRTSLSENYSSGGLSGALPPGGAQNPLMINLMQNMMQTMMSQTTHPNAPY